MAFKTAEKKQTGSANNHEKMAGFEVNDIMDTKKVIKEGVEEYQLGAGVYFTIYKEKGRVQLDFWGCCFFCDIKNGKNGYFLSLPAFKSKDGEWMSVISIYDKNFHSLMKELLTELAK